MKYSIVNMKRATLSLLGILLLFSCNDRYDYPIPTPSFEETPLQEVAKVTLSNENGEWKMFVDDEEFYINGACTNNYYGDVANFGGNVIRTYGISDDSRRILDEAQEAGLYVNFGLYMRRETDGFDYDNETAVAQQLAEMKEAIDRFKDHPALLCWSIGNEAEASYTNLKLWTAVNDVAKYIKEVDPNHPTTVALSNSDVTKIQHIASMAPEIDMLSINMYAPSLPNLLTNIQAAGWQKPYMVTEFGPRGTWQMNPEPTRILEWGGLVEQTSTEKAEIYRAAYQDHIISNKPNGCIGSFVFVWGYQRHGAVLTWYGLYDKKGYTFPAADEMQYVWTGTYPANKAPVIQDRDAIVMNESKAEDNIKVEKNSDNTASVVATDPDGDPLTYDWMIMKEGTASADGSLPDGISGLITDNTQPEISFKAPAETGGYRLIVFVRDDANKKVASAVIPFYVN
ncbi:glycoside hydrolase family 2 TIM barrel-domain containing protein [Sphingobacterium phlebotomi]|nr:glycoside hydrolase family 2 TIM barrel-domain containing protein [Sphingobacterium phlebotomi]